MLKNDGNPKDRSELFMLFLPIFYIVIGALLLFVPQINTVVLAELLGALLVLVGAVFVIRYFLRQSYLDPKAFGFAFGAFAVVLGICMIIKADIVGDSITVFLDICIMLTAIVKLQNAIQLFAMKSKFWLPMLVISIIFIICTVLIMIDPFPEGVQAPFTHIVLICDGVVSFASTILLRVLHKKRAATGLPVVEE